MKDLSGMEVEEDTPGLLETNRDGAPYFFRCLTCQNAVSQWDVLEVGHCRNCHGHKITPTNLTFVEKIIQIWKHPKVWTWKNDLK